MPPTHTDILHAYRHLYRAGLIAVQYSTPARHTIRDKLRRAFRSTPVEHYSPSRIENTVQFLLVAGAQKGMEHKIVKNLVLVDYWRFHGKKKRLKVPKNYSSVAEDAPFSAYTETIGFLNESMNLDLR